MMGISWGGFNSLQVAARRPPALKAIITVCSTDDRYDNDVHYIGGCVLAFYLLPWASVMLQPSTRARRTPTSSATAGGRSGCERLDGNLFLGETWLAHQRRDDYWRQGSVCEDYAGFRARCFAVGGWADAYTDAILRLLDGLSCSAGPDRAVGAHLARGGRARPAIGFLQEALRWWDRWLKDIDTT